MNENGPDKFVKLLHRMKATAIIFLAILAAVAVFAILDNRAKAENQMFISQTAQALLR